VKKARIRNAKTYHKLIHDDTKNTNEVDYFKKNLSNKEQLRVMKDLKEINKHMNIDKPYRLALLESPIPPKLKAVALQKLNVLKMMDPGDNEYYKMKQWFETFMRIPFGTYKDLSITMEDGVDACHEFMQNAMTTLDDCVYGLNDAKLQIMQMLGQWITNPAAMGSAIAIHGPMGTGKTSIVKDGISKLMGREFIFIPLGGCTDASFLEGHSYTYEGSIWGKIVQSIIDAKCMNPVIYFDELDKVSTTAHGEEIISMLIHLTDRSQNTEFHDRYFAGIDFDMSQCLFVFSFNDIEKVHPILRDRMNVIECGGYDEKDKLEILKHYGWPDVLKRLSFTTQDIVFEDDAMKFIIDEYSSTEKGVRNLIRAVETAVTRLNMLRVSKHESMKEYPFYMDVSFPLKLTPQMVKTLLKDNAKKKEDETWRMMYT
jgi:ATP-dependent Lon protease